jgi:beta-lactamase regulating signal transducer with metallopeptidase domain
MRTLVELVLSNAAIATVLALVAAVAARYCRRPQVVFALWLLVLLKLLTPPLVRIPVSILPTEVGLNPISSTSTRGIGQQSISPAVRDPENPRLDFESGPALSPGGEHKLATSPQDNAVIKFDSTAEVASAAINSEDMHTWYDRVDEQSDESSSDPANLNAIAPEILSRPQHLILWSELLLSGWVLGGMAWLAVVVYRMRRFRRQISRPWPVDLALQQVANEMARRVGLRRAPLIRLVDAVIPPMLWAMCRPAEILLPRPLIARLSPEQQAALLAHELAHFHRRDHLVRWLEVVVIAVYWWHPVAWIARRELQRAGEQCCDAWVLSALPGRECDYARVILETIDFLVADRRPAPMLANGLGPVHQLERRFAMILRDRPLRRLPVLAKLSLLLLGLLVLPLSTMAQSADEPATPELPAFAAQPVVSAQPAVEDLPAIEAAPAVADPVEPEVTAILDPPSALAPAVTAVQAEPSLQPTAAGSVERRLQRLEKLVESIAAEMRNQRIPSAAASNYRATMDNGVGEYARRRVAQNSINPYAMRDKATLSLSDLKKRRIDVEDQLANLQEQLAEIDDQIAKLQSSRPGKRYRDLEKK